MIRGLALSLCVFAAGSSVFGQPGFLPNGEPAAPPAAKDDKVDGDRRVPKYVRFDIDGNPEQMLGEFLKSKAGQGILKKMLGNEWQKLLDQPPRDIERLLKDKAGNGPFRQLIEEFLKENPGVLDGQIGGEKLGDVVKKFGEKIQEDPAFIEGLAKKFSKQFGDGNGPKLPKLPNFDPDPIDLPDLSKIAEQEKTLDEKFGEWFKDWFNDDRQAQVLDWFKETPALQDAVVDLARSMRPNAEGRGGQWMPKIPEGVGKWKMDLKPPKLPWDLGQMPRLPSIKLPTPPRMNIPMPKFGAMQMPQMPNLGAAPMPGTPRVSAASGEWLILAGGILGLVIGYFVLRKFVWDRGEEASTLREFLAHLPAEIQTRTDLRRAFDLLALSRLGEQARPWNHLQIAKQLGDSDPTRRAASAFAQLYEIARYTPGDERLSPDERAAVHQSLAALTGAAA